MSQSLKRPHAMSHTLMPLGGGMIDRDTETRMDPARVAAAWNEPTSRLLPTSDGWFPLDPGGPGPRRLSLLPTTGDHTDPDLFLGRIDGRAVFAREVSAEERVALTPGATWEHPFEHTHTLTAAERELVTITSALMRWHETAGYSPVDGTPTYIADGGWSRRDRHGAELFPRFDPAVIVVVEHENRVLLGSNALWESGRFSLLAGYVEAGETAEQTVVREIFEESGAQVTDVTYVGSQPWPFPRSLMLGFRARLADGCDPSALTPDPNEISELRWFTRDELQNPPAGIMLPMSLSIARWLMDRWVAEGDTKDLA